MQKLSKHDRYVENLCSLIEDRYDRIEKHVVFYSARNRIVAEVDILAHHEHGIDVYEVKCSHRVVKAQQQLQKIRKVVGKRVLNSFFFCGASGQLISI